MFNHGTLFYTVGPCGSSIVTKTYIEAIIDEKNNDAILADIVEAENAAPGSPQDINDYHTF